MRMTHSSGPSQWCPEKPRSGCSDGIEYDSSQSRDTSQSNVSKGSALTPDLTQNLSAFTQRFFRHDAARANSGLRDSYGSGHRSGSAGARYRETPQRGFAPLRLATNARRYRPF